MDEFIAEGRNKTWSLGGKFLVGLGSGSKNGDVKGTLYQNDGKGKLIKKESVRLDINNMPSHNHVIYYKNIRQRS